MLLDSNNQSAEESCEILLQWLYIVYHQTLYSYFLNVVSAMLDFSSDMISKCKLDRSGVSEMLISGGIDTMFECLVFTDPQFWRPFMHQ